MPMGDNDTDWGRPTRTFLYGPDKTKKTWWACRAAEAGFNVILIDGDDGSSIIKQLPMEARKRILVVDVVNTPGNNAFARFVATFMKGDAFLWNEQRKVSNTPNTKRDAAQSYAFFDIKKLGMNDVVILDSWTALAASLMMEWAKENNVELTAVEKEGDQFSLMGYQSRYLNYVLDKLKTFPCHMIVIGHETVYEKWEGKGTERKMVEQKTQPFSSTGPHAKKIGASFSNVLRFKKQSDVSFRIDAGGDQNTMGGCRQLAPALYKWEDISPATIFAAVGSKGDKNIPCLGAVWIPPGGEFNTGLIKASTPVPSVSEAVVAQPQIVDASVKLSPLEQLRARKKLG